MKSSKTALVVSGVIGIVQICCGFLLAVMFGLSALICLFLAEIEGATFAIMIFIAGIGVLLIVAGFRRKRSVRDFKKYVGLLSGDATGSIERLAASTGVPVDIVTENLEYMIEKKYFVNAFINKQTNSIVVVSARTGQSIGQDNTNQESERTEDEALYVTVICKSCGGATRIRKGETGDCDYCGLPIQQ